MGFTQVVEGLKYLLVGNTRSDGIVENTCLAKSKLLPKEVGFSRILLSVE